MFGLILVYCLTAVGILGSLSNPLYGLFVYVFFAMLRPQFMWGFAGDMTGLSQWVGIAMLVGWAMKGFGGMKFGRASGVTWILIAFAAWAALSAAMGIDPPRSNIWVIELAKIVAPFLVGATMLQSRKQVRWMLWVIVASHGYIAYDMNNWYYVRGYNFIRESGYGFMDNNSFGLSLVTVIGLAAALALASKKWPERLLALGCAVLILSTIVLTYSRGAMVGLITVGLASMLLLPKRPTYVLLMLLGLLASGRLMGQQVLERFATTFAEEDQRDASAQSRVDLWAACLEIGMSSPLVGIGPRNFPLVATNYGFTAGKEAHSTWMQAIAEVGFVGAALLLLFYLFTMIRLLPVVWRKWTPDRRDEAAFAFGVLVSLAGFFVSAQFVTMAGLETPYYVAMVAVAMFKTQGEIVVAATEAVVAAPVSDSFGRSLESGRVLKSGAPVADVPVASRRNLGVRPAPKRS